MARLFGKINGFTKGRAVSGGRDGRSEARRLAEDQIDVEVSANRRTTASVQMFADGSGTLTLVRDGVTICERWNAETADSIRLDLVQDESLPALVDQPPHPRDREAWGVRVGEVTDARD